jgi:uncharacterized surface protein with fasciclin (FAS1) repeats
MKSKMKFKISILMGLALLFVTSCSKNWEDHFDIYPETVNKNVWDVMQNDPEISKFVQILKDLKYDTLFLSDIPYTLFVPTNNAVDQYKTQNTIDQLLVDYHISSHFIQSEHVVGKRYIQTLGEKFALFEKNGSELKLDGISLMKESPLYKNGKYYILEQVAKPRPNLYQYFDATNPVLKEYIDSQDSVVLDRENSKPIGFDEFGNTVFDSVLIDYNKFEVKYFPVSIESRNESATIVFPKEQDYNNALTAMALDMNIPGFVDYRDIPLDWQYDILIPHLLEQGVFENMLEPEEFMWKSPKDTLKLKNILGDSIQIFYTPIEKAISSNGYAYNYDNFRIPDSLYSGSVKFETEWLLDETGINKYAWNSRAKVQSSQFFAPLQEYIKGASNDTIGKVMFPKSYSGNYSLEFNTKNLFPRKYAMIVRTHMNIGGIYDIYVNDKLVKTFDWYDYVKYKQIIPSVMGGRYLPTGNFNNFDMWVDNLTEYGSAKIRFEYKEPGKVTNNGLVIDYIDFLPAAN